MNEGRRALLLASIEVRANGEVGKPGFVSVSDWLLRYADKQYPVELEGGTASKSTS